MKHYLLFFLLMVIGMSGWSQSSTDQKALLQKCLELPQLQDFCSAGKFYVMQHGVSFDFNQLELDNGSIMVFLEKSTVKNSGITEFFLFREFEINTQSALISGQYVLNFSGDVNNYVDFELHFERQAENWKIVTSEIYRR